MQFIGFRYTAVLAITPALAIALADTVGRPFGNPFRECVGDIHGIVRPIRELKICKRRELRIDLLIGAAQFLKLRRHCIARKDDCRISSPLHSAGKSLKPLDKVCILTQFCLLAIGDTGDCRNGRLRHIRKQRSCFLILQPFCLYPRELTFQRIFEGLADGGCRIFLRIVPAHAEIEFCFPPMSLNDERDARINVLNRTIHSGKLICRYFLLLIDHFGNAKDLQVRDAIQFLRQRQYSLLTQFVQILLADNITKQLFRMDETIHQFLLRRGQQCAVRRLFHDYILHVVLL